MSAMGWVAGPRLLRSSTDRPSGHGSAAIALVLLTAALRPASARGAPAPEATPDPAPPHDPAPAASSELPPRPVPTAPLSPRDGPRDPNERPPLPPPNGQPAPDSLRLDVDHTTDASDRQRVWLTAAPVYASFRLPFLGRPSVPARGGGVMLAVQVPVWRPFGARLFAAHTVHAAYDQFTRDDDDELVQTAARGSIQGTHAGVSATFTMDLGRVSTTLDAGAGAMWIRSPEAIQDGQFGGSCRSEGVCDTGLTCSAENICRVATTPQIHGGFTVDVKVGDRATVGGELRYYALITAPTSYPVYLVAALRAGLRF